MGSLLIASSRMRITVNNYDGNWNMLDVDAACTAEEVKQRLGCTHLYDEGQRLLGSSTLSDYNIQDSDRLWAS